MKQYVYTFKEGNKEMKDLLGGKGANLAEMYNLGLPVPNGFIITTEACIKYYQNNEVIAEDILNEINNKLKELENDTNKYLGNPKYPLLLSVRSGAKVSMPGMMDTVLNIGLNDEVVNGLIETTNNKRFIYDSYRRLIQMFADVVLGFNRNLFEEIINNVKNEKGIQSDLELTEEDLINITNKYKNLFKELTGYEFPQDPNIQLMECIKAVFKSWHNERAISYRKLNNIPDNIGTAVNIQSMVYGNFNDNSATGVLFSRNPATGENKLYGEYLINAQGEDIVAGIRTPKNIDNLENDMPHIYEELIKYANMLEHHYLDMQDIEWTVEDNKLYIMQTRNGKRTAQAAVKIAVDLVNEGLIDKEKALMMINPNQLEHLLHPKFDPEVLKEVTPIAKGLAASPGATTGQIYFNSDDLINAYNTGNKNLILVRLETSPEDIEGMNYANGILTIRGGMTSHAAVVARGMGKCCISGCEDLIINETNKTLTTKDGKLFNEGDYLSLDGSTGYIYENELKTIAPSLTGDFATFINWADEISDMRVRANADTAKDTKQAIDFGAVGIGLCRTEHMFFGDDRIMAFREMILSDNNEEREKILNKLEPIQREDFINIFEVLEGKPLTVRYLDPPLHEFLPKDENEIRLLSEQLNKSITDIEKRINELKEYNPMMGHRGCRLAITYPEIIKMQTRAIIEAAIYMIKNNKEANLEIMIPLINDVKELKYLKGIINTEINNIITMEQVDFIYKIGTMIEVPRACIMADEIAKEVDFFSFGTNDLTQMTYGFSRDDAEKFLTDYYNKNIYKNDPFVTLDPYGVGSLINIAVFQGRHNNSNLKLGICGEHGGEPNSIEFLQQFDLDYVSCSPYRVPIARLAVAQAKIKKII